MDSPASESNPDIRRLRVLIFALKFKTVANGCTQGEARAASEKVSQLEAMLAKAEATAACQAKSPHQAPSAVDEAPPTEAELDEALQEAFGTATDWARKIAEHKEFMASFWAERAAAAARFEEILEKIKNSTEAAERQNREYEALLANLKKQRTESAKRETFPPLIPDYASSADWESSTGGRNVGGSEWYHTGSINCTPQREHTAPVPQSREVTPQASPPGPEKEPGPFEMAFWVTIFVGIACPLFLTLLFSLCFNDLSAFFWLCHFYVTAPFSAASWKCFLGFSSILYGAIAFCIYQENHKTNTHQSNDAERELCARSAHIQLAQKEAHKITSQLGYSNEWVAGHWFGKKAALEKQVGEVKRFTDILISNGGQTPAKKVGGIYGSASPAIDYEVDAAMRGNHGGLTAMFED